MTSVHVPAGIARLIPNAVEVINRENGAAFRIIALGSTARRLAQTGMSPPSCRVSTAGNAVFDSRSCPARHQSSSSPCHSDSPVSVLNGWVGLFAYAGELAVALPGRRYRPGPARRSTPGFTLTKPYLSRGYAVLRRVAVCPEVESDDRLGVLKPYSLTTTLFSAPGSGSAAPSACTARCCRTRTARRCAWWCRGSMASRAPSRSSRSALSDKQPPTSWNMAASNEYGFYSNVNPDGRPSALEPGHRAAYRRREGRRRVLRAGCAQAQDVAVQRLRGSRWPRCIRAWT